MIVPDGDRPTRSFRLSGRTSRFLLVAGSIVSLIVVVLVGTWGFIAVRAYEAVRLEQRVEELLAREERVEELASLLTEVERGYNQIRGMFGSVQGGADGDPWIPPPAGGLSAAAGRDGAGALPTSWPLTERGFVTQPLLEDAHADHPGIDIAVPQGSYIRASGGGTVVEGGEDPVYGSYLVLEHEAGYRSLYAHASMLLVAPGDIVRRHEVIALTGSTGRSTAPHLHFELLQDGEPVDPLSMVAQP